MNDFGVFQPTFLQPGFLHMNASILLFFLFLVPFGTTIQLPHSGHRICSWIQVISTPFTIVMQMWCHSSFSSLYFLPNIILINDSNVQVVSEEISRASTNVFE
jgi:hypothetical protein